MAEKFAEMCSLQSSPPVWLKYDPDTDQLSLLDLAGDAAGDDGGGVRALTAARPEQARGRARTVHWGRRATSPTRFLRSGRRAADADPNLFHGPFVKRSFLARSCPCDASGRTYCLVDGVDGDAPDYCGVPWWAHYSGNATAHIGCFALDGQTLFIRNTWPVVVFWYAALLLSLLVTANGRLARAYAAHVLCPRRRGNERRAARILAREDDRRRRLRAALRAASVALGPGRHLVRAPGMRAPYRDEADRRAATLWWSEQAAQWGLLGAAVEEAPRVEYVLKTRAYDAARERARRAGGGAAPAGDGAPSTSAAEKEGEARRTALDDGIETEQSSPANAVSEPDGEASVGADAARPPQSSRRHEEEEEEAWEEEEEEALVECAICLTEVEDGVQVGALPCGHIFHVDCLREWIPRRNACPLCQAPGIATPRPAPDGDAAPRRDAGPIAPAAEGQGASGAGTAATGGGAEGDARGADDPGRAESLASIQLALSSPSLSHDTSRRQR